MRVLGKPIATADNSLSAPGVYQKVTFTEDKMVNSIRCGVISHNASFTGIKLLVFTNRSSAPGKLLYQSANTVLKATIDEGDSYALADVAFTFSSNLAFRGGDSYIFALYVTGSYTGDATNHIAWASGWPDPVHDTGLTVQQKNAAKLPLSIIFTGADV